MNKEFPFLSEYAGFLLNNRFDELIQDSIRRAREENLTILKHLTNLTEAQIYQISQRGFEEDLLVPLVEGKPFDKVKASIERWKSNVLILPKDQISGSDVTGIYHIRKLSMLEMLRHYEYSKTDGIFIHQEIESYFNICINIGYQAYEEIQRGALRESQNILNGILRNIPVIVSRIDNQGNTLSSIGSGLSSIGLKDGELVGTNVFKNYPDALNTRKALHGEKVTFEGVAVSKIGEQRFYQNYFFPEENGAIGFSIDVTDQKIAEQKLQQQLRIFDTALSNTVDFNYIFDLDGKFIYVNKPLLELWGKRMEDAAGKNFRELGYPEELVLLHDGQIREAITTKQPVKGENSYTNPDGKKGYYQYVFVPVLTDQGKVEAIVGTTHDITELKETAEKQYKSIFDSTNDAILIYDQIGNLVEVNPAGHKMHGYSYEEMIGLNGMDFIPKEDHAIFLNFIKEVKEGKEYFAELRHICKDGSFLFVEKKGVGFTYKGKPHLLSVVHDVTEQKKALNALKESEDRFRTLADNIPNLAWITNAEGTSIWYNKRCFEYTGTSTEDIKESLWDSIIHPDMVAKVREGWVKSLEMGQPFEMVLPLKGQDGVFRSFLARVIPCSDENGNIVKWFGTSTDVSEVENKKEELLKINSELDNFIYTASHDLKAPVANIEGLIYSLQEELPAEVKKMDQVQIYMDLISKSVERFKKTILDLTEVSKTKKILEEDIDLISCEEIIDDVSYTIHEQIKQADANISVNISDFKKIRFSRKNFKSVVYNLLSNAVKYRDVKRPLKINISTYQEQDYLVLSVEDNGLGISKENQLKLFTMFKRFHDHVEGTGIGLYIVKKIVENAGGKIEVQSELNKGTKFTVYFKNYN